MLPNIDCDCIIFDCCNFVGHEILFEMAIFMGGPKQAPGG